MGLTSKSTGFNTLSPKFDFSTISKNDKIIALAGNPNVGKSTVFNALTGLKQHTGNWPGKTVENARGICTHNKNNYVLVDIPGTYSLKAHSCEEEIARDFITSGIPHAVIVICDATCLERNLNLVIQVLEITPKVVVGVNLMDEASKKGIKINLKKISQKTGIPFVGLCARSGKGLKNLMNAAERVIASDNKAVFKMKYPQYIEEAVEIIQKEGKTRKEALSLLENQSHEKALKFLASKNIAPEKIPQIIVSSIIITAEGICADTVSSTRFAYDRRTQIADKLITNRIFGYPLMLFMLAFLFWLTISGANYPSSLLSSTLLSLENPIFQFLTFIHLPYKICHMLVFGVYRCLSWVVSVMLPPMAIFFPLFTLLEDFGFLPRIAFNLDHIFKKCKTCGKQALTMCMGLGCNAAGVVGCRIIDSPRERIIAILTNSLIPCNGRFPMIISVITIFFAGNFAEKGTIISSLGLTLVIALGISLTFLLSALLSKTFLKGEASSFTMELPPYRKPLIFKTLTRSIFDRTLFVLGRAVAVAAPSGLLIWIMANVTVCNETLLFYCCHFLDPLGNIMGLDGVMLMAFILGFPANEIVMPIAVMAYMSGGTLSDISNLSYLKELLCANGWTCITAICTVIFSLVHFPCSTTAITVYKETKSIKWTVLSIALPTLLGMLLCIFINFIGKLII